MSCVHEGMLCHISVGTASVMYDNSYGLRAMSGFPLVVLKQLHWCWPILCKEPVTA